MSIGIHRPSFSYIPSPPPSTRPNEAPAGLGHEIAGLVLKAHKVKADEQAIATAMCEIRAMKAELDSVCQELDFLQQRGSSVSRKRIQPVQDLAVLLQTAIDGKTKAISEAAAGLHG